ncbi:hypothetical protein [Methylomagnum sp.]
MKWLFSLFKNNNDTPDADLLDRYKQFREASRNLNVTLAKQLPKVAAPECGKKLGIFKAGTLILNNDDEIAILYDYAFHYYRRAGKSVIDRYLEATPPVPESIEAKIFQAMLKSYYSLFRVEQIKPRQGAVLRDLLTGTTLDLMNISLSDTGNPGIILAGRILPFADFAMSSGTMIPVPEFVYEEKITSVMQKFPSDKERSAHPLFSAAQEAAFVAQIIRAVLREGGEDNVFYTDIED